MLTKRKSILSTADVKEFKKYLSCVQVEKNDKDEKPVLDLLPASLLKKYVNLPASSMQGRYLIATGQVPSEKYCDTCGGRLTLGLDNRYGMFCGRQCIRHTDKIKDKIKKTSMERYGVEHVSKAADFQERRKATFNKLDIGKVVAKRRRTCLKKYGVDNPSKVASIQQKIVASSMKKKVCVVRGKRFVVQGYEIHAIKPALKTLKITSKDLRASAVDEVPTVRYTYGGKSRIYFPDFYVPRLNLMIEVKGSYTLLGSRDIFDLVKAKAKATIDEGYEYALLLVRKVNGEFKCTRLRKSWIEMSYREARRAYS